jgi:hypothetical protein
LRRRFMERNWKEFAAGPVRKGGLHVTICRKGNIMIGAAAFDPVGSAGCGGFVV